MVNFLQGPGQNIKFCSITTGIDINPTHGGIAKLYYEWFKSILALRTDIQYEHVTIREVEINASSFLNAYNSTPRLVWQFLYGTTEHNDPWTGATFSDAIDNAVLPRTLRPNDGEYCIDFYASKETGMKIFENRLILATNVWVEKMEFYFSNVVPTFEDGKHGDIWFVSNDIDVTLWYKNAFKWSTLDSYTASQTPAGSVIYSNIDPGNTVNGWWFDYSGIIIRKYSAQTNTWDIAPPTVISSTPPTGMNDGDLWVDVSAGKFLVFVWDSGINDFVKTGISSKPVQDRATNSTFVGTSGDNNFIITCGDDVLEGAPITGGVSLEIRKDGVAVSSAVDCINFKGDDINVSLSPGCVDVEHLPITTLPEQTGSPIPAINTGKIYTLDIAGITELFYIDNSGSIVQLTNQGNASQNISLATSVFNAVAGQTIFTVPVSVQAILNVKINGLDTLGWSFTTPSVTYFAAVGGYTIQAGDEITIIYYI